MAMSLQTGALRPQQSVSAPRSARSLRLSTQALFGKKKEPKSTTKKRKKGEKPSDAKLLSDAYYNRSPDGKMEPEQYAALARKIRGSAKQFFKENVDNKYDYVDSADIDTRSNQVPGLAFLVLITFAVLGTAVYVATQTANTAAVT